VHFAARNGDEATLRALVELGADVNVTDTDGNRALHPAAHNGHEAAVRALVAVGADVNATDSAGNRALHLARQNSHATTVRALEVASRVQPGQPPDPQESKPAAPL
jgi:ankyrin repeat protein